ncbi:restriction endonuclease PLD domain-containing protein [Chryseobacterium sp. PET-29]|uniref:restriction endonuclease PLD domain-containing protein n=1 Tax=Chryseobacterium sp. PET-29 TaxID=2983267 RepID=UPI0021E5357F|nr:restriction endonuclease PLD domain-containing protein [Chryseobacterium sp. PET-29]
MSVWEQYTADQRKEYIQFLQVYGALSNLFRQKHGDAVPHLDSKFQETVFAKIFDSENVDIGNTPHDVLSVFGNKRIGIGLKTWMGSRPSFQKVMQLKKYKNEIDLYKTDAHSLASKISGIKNERMSSDYVRLGLTETDNIYHYVTRDKGLFSIHECSYPLIDVSNITTVSSNDSGIVWSDGLKEYKYTFGDSQIWQRFDSDKYNTLLLNRFDIKIIEDPFSFLLKAYLQLTETIEKKNTAEEFVEIYLPLYSYKSKEVEEKSGLNAWNAAPKNKGSNTLRPLNEIYIPIPIDFHQKFGNFFCPDILKIIEERKISRVLRPEVRFHLALPDGRTIPALLTGDNLKNFQSGSLTERDQFGNIYGQSALGQWLLVDVLGLKSRTLVTKDWLEKKGTDSVRLWRKKQDYSLIHIDFAPVGAFEAFMKGEPIPENDDAE